ncbi:MAG: filamentous hemagglutinin N-terminal domain-containing protein, partial [Gammaproteobacteria bacterium]|nr:filamentous hemagglutinin N-terminal domain-containing protein [Gammaproteobacteria bacterium]
MHKRTKKLAPIALAIWGGCALANPSGPTVVNGSATFSQPNANTLNVNNSRNAIINWQSFSIGHGQTTNFIQPSSSSAVMNRVISNNPSKIYGNLNSNGKVFLINQHGMMIGAGARINTAGFYGSTLNITNEDFLKGNLKFEGGGFGGIQNHGYIHAGPNGNVVLVAPDIENGGVIEVDNGNVILAAGESIRITSLNDAAIEFDVQSPDNGIINLGSIIARQGAARLFAGNLKHSGSINATGIVRNADGSISLVAQQDIEVSAGATLNADGEEGGNIRVQSHHGDVHFSGTASARGESGKGGKIEILGERVGLFGEAKLDVSGRTGGGEVLVGGDFQGGGDTQTASQTQVSLGASIHADAIESGDGGKVIVWADDFTLFNGLATTKGGAGFGDGGFIEISGKGNLGYYGSVDASAKHGAAGTILFDPISVTIQAGGVTTLPANPLTFAINPGQNLIFDPLAITAITDTGAAVEIQADQDIIVNDAISTDEGGTSGLITFRAGRSILINAPITTDNSDLRFYANDTGATAANRGTGEARITLGFGATIDTFGPFQPAQGGNVEFWMNTGASGTSGDITVGNIVANHVLIKHNGLTDGGDILQNSGSTITASTLFIDHDGPANGTVGTGFVPLNLRVDNVGAHIHGATQAPNGIFIDARPNLALDVTVGETCYGNGAVGCSNFGSHLIKGLETLLGGELELSVTGGGLSIVEPIIITDNVKIFANSDIEVNAGILNQNVSVSGSGVSLTSFTGNVLVSGGAALNSDASIESTLGDVNVTALDLIFIGGTGTNSDAVVVANNGVRNLNFTNPDGVCSNCSLLGADPRANGATETGVFAAAVSPIAASFWDGGGGTNDWNVALNWTLDTVPTLSSDVIIGDFQVNVTALSEAFNLTMGAGGAITQSAGTLTILGNADLFGGYTLAGGALDVSGSMAIDGPFNLQQGVVTSDGDITVAGVTTWNPATTGGTETLTLDGAGILFAFGGFDLGNFLDLNDTLTLDKVLVIDSFSSWFGAGSSPVTINTSAAGTIVNNADILAANGAQIAIDVAVINNGLISKAADSAGLLLFSNVLSMNPGSELQIEEVGTVQLSGSSLTLNQAHLSGAGTFIGDVISLGGLIDIEDSVGNPATLTINGSLALDSDSTIAFDIGGPATGALFDVLNISNNLTLGSATMVAFWENQFAATDLANPYVLINAGAISGGFGNEYLPAGAEASLTSITTTTYEFTSNIGANNIIFWDNGGGDELWITDANWVGDLAPGPSDYAVIQYDIVPINVVVTGTPDVAGVEAQQDLTIAAGAQLNIGIFGKLIGDSLTINGDITTDGNVIMANDALWNSGTLGGNGKFTLHQFGVLDINGNTNLAADFDGFGIIRGVGNMTIAPTAIFTSDGKVQPAGDGVIGVLTFDGNFINTGTIDIDIAATGTPGTSYDQLVVTGDAFLSGFMSLNPVGGYTVSDDNFTPITYASISDSSMVFLPIGSETVTPDFAAPDLDINLFFAVTTNWTGGGADNFWNNAANWDLGVPGVTDIAVIGFGSSFNITIVAAANAGTLSLASDASITVSGGSLSVVNDSTLNGVFVMNGGSLDLSGMTLTLAGGFNWSGGSTIQSDGSPSFLVLPAGATVSGAGIHTLDDVTVNNSGIFQLTSAAADDFRLETGATFNNAGLFDITNDSNIFSASSGAFVNTNTLRKSGGAGTSTLNAAIAFSNTAATIDLQSGTLVLGAGPLTLDAGSVLSGIATLGNDVLNNGGSVQPGGQDTIGTLTIAGDFTQTLGSIVIEIDNAVTTAGSDYDQLNVTGQADFGGSMSLLVIGNYTVANNDTLDPITYATYGGTPFGTIVAIGGENVTPDYTAPDLTLTLSFSGLFTFTGAVDNSWNNAGNWDQGVPGIGNDALIPTGFNVTIAAAANAGTLSLAAGSTLDINSGGVLTIASSATFDGLLSINAGNLNITTATATVNAGLNWTGTSVITGGTLNLNSAFNISGGAANILDGVSANVTGNTTYTLGNLTLANGTVLNTNAVFNFAGDVGIADGGGATSTFNSADGATIVKSVGVSSSVDSTVLSTHAGSVDVQTGTLDLNLLLLDLGAGDVFSGAGNYVGNVTNNGGTIRPGAAAPTGALSITGNFVSNSGRLEIDVQAAALFDQLIATNATFGGGSIDVNHLGGYIPTVGLQQQVVVCGVSCAGSFGAINSPAGVVYGQTTNATNLTLDVVSVTFAWDGGGDGINWTDALNWSLDVAPNNTIDVVLPAINVQVNAAGAQANNLTINGGLAILGGGDLTINDFTANPS